MQNKRNIKSIKVILPQDMRTNEITNEIDDIEKQKEKMKQKGLKYEPKNTYMIFSNVKQ